VEGKEAVDMRKLIFLAALVVLCGSVMAEEPFNQFWSKMSYSEKHATCLGLLVGESARNTLDEIAHKNIAMPAQYYIWISKRDEATAGKDAGLRLLNFLDYFFSLESNSKYNLVDASMFYFYPDNNVVRN
jgi:hypothetical protein